MINILFISFLFIFLSYKNILLLNEESLILLCFVTFVLLILQKFSTTIKTSLIDQSKTIESILKQSLASILAILKLFSVVNQQPKQLYIKFYQLGNYYYKLVSLLGNRLPKYKTCQLNIAYNNQLKFLNKVEKQTIKLLALILIKKLDKLIELKQFYSTTLKTNYFLCLNTISLRECIHSIYPGSIK